jgi:hypothetical protein
VLSCYRRSAAAVLVSLCNLAVGTPVASPAATPTDYVGAITKICSRALLFEDSHGLGTRADARAIARDIRASTGRRLDRVAAVRVPRSRIRLVERWIALERRLADAYADSWVGIFDAIDATYDARRPARLPALLRRRLHAPDRVRLAAARLERVLQVPDCTGGGASPTAPQAGSPSAAPPNSLTVS